MESINKSNKKLLDIHLNSQEINYQIGSNKRKSQRNIPSRTYESSPQTRKGGARGSNGYKMTEQVNNNNSSFIISLSDFEDKQRRSYDSANQSITSQSETTRVSYDSEQQTKRALIYGNQSYKDMHQDPNQTTMQANNQIFEMVFLANKKRQYNQTASTAGSFSKKLNEVMSIQQKPKQWLCIGDFKLGKKLGAGKFGQVQLARHKQSGFICAIKRIPKTNIDKKLLIQLIRQIKIQSFLNHPNIVKLYTFFCDSTYIYLVLEICYSGQLYGFLKKKRKLNEPLTKNIIQQTLKALDYMHENQIIHRDLKPENIIFQSAMVKLCDFGWSISSKTMRQTFCGTPLYVSPQLLKRKNYNNKIDVWSIGILTYQLLFGRVPFDITTQRDFIKIVEDEIKFSKATKVTQTAKDFILNCLKKDPNERYTVPQLLEHPFVKVQEVVSMGDMY